MPGFEVGLVVAYLFCVIAADPVRQLTGFLLDEVAFAAFFTVVIVRALCARDVRVGVPGLLGLLFASYATLVSLYRGVNGLVMLEGVALLCKPILLFMAAYNLNLNRNAAMALPRAIGRCLAAVALAALAYALVFDLVLQANPLPGFPPPPRFAFPPLRGFFVHPGVFSSVMTVCAIWALTSFLFTAKPFDLLIFTVSTAGVVGSQRIKGILFLFASLFLATYFVRFIKQDRKYGVLSMAGTVTVLCVAAGGAYVLFDSLFSAEWNFYFSEASDAVRTKLLLSAFEIDRDTNGFGAGAGKWGGLVSILHYSEYYYRYGLATIYGATQSDPWFLLDQWWAWYLGEVGYYGFILFLVFCGTILVEVFRARRSARRLGTSHAALCVTACLVMIYGLSTGFAAANMSAAPTGCLVMTLPGIVLAIWRASDRRSSRQGAARSVGRPPQRAAPLRMLPRQS